MGKYTYLLLVVILTALIFALSFVTDMEKPYIEYASLPRCSNNVVISDELRSSVMNLSASTIIRGTGESYFNNHFIFKNIDYSIDDCVFVVRYEFTYDELHSEMSITTKAFGEGNVEVTETNSFLRPVGLLVTPAEVEQIAAQQNLQYDYYNIVIDMDGQTFLYKFYKDTLAEGNLLVLTIDGQSKEVAPVKAVKAFVPIV